MSSMYSEEPARLNARRAEESSEGEEEEWEGGGGEGGGRGRERASVVLFAELDRALWRGTAEAHQLITPPGR